MPLSTPAEREHIHTRSIDCKGYLRKDGLWDIEAHMTDTKTYAFDNDYRGRMQPGDPIHDLWLRVTIDDRFVIQAAEAAMDGTPYGMCIEAAPNFERLRGIRIGPGWMKEVRKQVGGVNGCTHLVELLQTVATVAYQTTYSAKAVKKNLNQADSAGDAGGDGQASAPKRRPPHLHTCHALRTDGEVVKQHYPEWYTGD